MLKLVFASNNNHKLSEVRSILSGCEILSLSDIGCHADIPETAATLEGNSLQKAEYVWEHYHLACFADDTGLEIAALGGAPGVITARWAGEPVDDAANRRKALQLLQGESDRRARFRTVITLIAGGEVRQVEGCVNGKIGTEEQGEVGFGYDSVFIPEGYEQTFAQLTQEQKNAISHRAMALRELKKII